MTSFTDLMQRQEIYPSCFCLFSFSINAFRLFANDFRLCYKGSNLMNKAFFTEEKEIIYGIDTQVSIRFRYRGRQD